MKANVQLSSIPKDPQRPVLGSSPTCSGRDVAAESAQSRMSPSERIGKERRPSRRLEVSSTDRPLVCEDDVRMSDHAHERRRDAAQVAELDRPEPNRFERRKPGKRDRVEEG